MIETKIIVPGEAYVILVDTPESVKIFQQLIQRGAATWADAPPEIKEFADLITSGRVLQDYHSQNTDQRTKKESNDGSQS